MLERRRAARNYRIVPGEGDDEDHDVELGETGLHPEEQESGVIPASTQPTVTEELDNWDENAEDWDEEANESVEGEGQKTPASSTEAGLDTKKRSD